MALNETAKKVSEGLHSSVSCGRIASSEDDFMEKYGSASSSNMDNTSGSTSFFYPAAAFIYDGNIRDFYKWIAKIAIWKNAFYNPHNRILSVPLMRKGLYGNVPLQVIARHSDVGIHIYNAEEIRFKMDEDGVVTMFPSLWSPYYDKWLIILNHLEIKDNQWYTSIQE
ncbi:MAG: hypothetical protein LBT63_00970 [Holosporaceae bacterium]|nr:hypothetical protein [Holosporaceae bacterium]